MEDTIVRNLIIGAIFGIVCYLADRLGKIIRSKSEGARRFKIVASVGLLILVGSALFAMLGPVGAIGTGIAIAAIVWVVKGFKTSNPVNHQQFTPSSATGKHPEVDAPETDEIKQMMPVRMTVIPCPQCGNRLRVVAGKYIDVTCPHCQTVFRTHS
jgi:hypothetical protein